MIPGLVVYPKVLDRYVREQLPFMATESILMAGVQSGGDRQQLHESVRQHSMEVTVALREQGAPNDLIARLAADPAFESVKDQLGDLATPERFIGRSPQQVVRFIEEHVQPVRDKYAEHLGQTAELNV